MQHHGEQMPLVCCAMPCCVMSMIASKILHYLHAELIWETQLLRASATIQAAAGCSQTVAEPSSAMPWHTSVLPQASFSFNSAAPHLHCPLSTGPSSPGSHAVSHCPSLATCQPPQHSLPSAVTTQVMLMPWTQMQQWPRIPYPARQNSNTWAVPHMHIWHATSLRMLQER